MKKRTYLLIATVWMAAIMAVHAHPTVAGRVKSYSNGVLVIEMEDKSLKKLLITKASSVKYRGSTSISALPVGAKVSVEVLGSVIANPAKAGKIVDWSKSSEIVAVGAKAPYYTQVGQYATSSGGGGVPDGAPVGNHAASHTLGAVAHGGSINQPTQDSHPVTPDGVQPSNNYSTAGQTGGSNQYPNQGASMAAPMESLGMSPYGNGQANGTGGQANPAMQQPGMQPGMDSSMYGMDPSLGMSPIGQPGMDPSMYGMDPSAGMSNPYSQSNLGTGQSGSLMGLSGDDDGEYSAGGDMMGLGDTAYGGDNKITGSILQVDLQRGFITVQAFTNPQPQKVLMGPGSSASPDLLIPGKMVQITGRATPQGFQAAEIQAAPGF